MDETCIGMKNRAPVVFGVMARHASAGMYASKGRSMRLWEALGHLCMRPDVRVLSEQWQGVCSR